MGIRGVGQNYYHSNTTTDTGTKNVDSFHKKTSEQKEKDRRRELLEGYLGKRTQTKSGQRDIFYKKIARSELKKKRLEKSSSNKSQIEKIINAYKANFLYNV